MSRSPTPLDLNEVLQKLRLEENIELFAPHWEESAAAKPSIRPSFLQPDSIRNCVRLANLSDDVLPALCPVGVPEKCLDCLVDQAVHREPLLKVGSAYAAQTLRNGQW